MGSLFYGVLDRLSPDYPPLTGKLHTRYSPVRRSPPEYCYPVMPLDLHVLSLSLAFILSQDQTLRCQNCFLFISLAQNPVLYCLFLTYLFWMIDGTNYWLVFFKKKEREYLSGKSD